MNYIISKIDKISRSDPKVKPINYDVELNIIDNIVEKYIAEKSIKDLFTYKMIKVKFTKN